MSVVPAPVVRLAGVSHRYQHALALDAVDLEIVAGRMVGLVGPDGVGKSTLLAIIAGARRIQDGRVEVLGGDMREARHRRAVCSRIAYMPQGLGRNLYPALSVRENLDFFARLFGQSRAERAERIGELLAATGLAAFAGRSMAQLSGGMKQKLGLCCALIHDPDLLVLDEPTTGVDPLSRRHFWELIAALRARHRAMSLVISTAYFEEAGGFDEVVAMEAGRVLARGAPEALRASTRSATLEQAFVSLLPERRREGYGAGAAERRREGYGAGAAERTIAEDAPIAIEAEELTRRFGDFVAVDRASFRIRRGEIFGFIGSNGCGKTTTMKMMTGLLPASAGRALLFGKPVDARDLRTRRRVGFMSQSFSLYTELTVRQNLALHARLFHLPPRTIGARIAELAHRFDLEQALGQHAQDVPLGVRQRLSLAVAVIHDPEVLILDEPTSGVDPVARDRFWALLADLAGRRGVTIFISTHFMNEAERCDRIALMHEGRVLALGPPADIVRAAGAANLEEAFVRRISATEPPPLSVAAQPVPAARSIARRPHRATGFDARRCATHALREMTEMLRDPVRMAFALAGPVLLMLVFGLGITFDIENVAYAALDRDATPESRAYLENFSSSRYFEPHEAPANEAALERRLRNGELRFALEVPAGFGRSLRQGRMPEVEALVDGAFPFRGQTTRGYIEGVHAGFVARLARDAGLTLPAPPADVALRFRYNQDLRSVYAVVPGVMMIILMMIPAIMTAVGVVREKELGSITNLYVTPTTRLEFLLGKQLPYVALAMVNFASLAVIALAVFEVPLKGSAPALVAGALVYVTAATAFGMVVSSFVRTQLAATFAAAILASLPTIQYSGFMLPVSSMSPDAQLIGRLFPPMYFQHVSLGTFTKGLGFADVLGDLAAMGVLIAALLAIALVLLRKQEA